MKIKLKIYLSSILIVSCINDTASQANCTATATGYVPINDLGTNISPVTGLMGGLYPNGSNYMPPAHKSAGLQMASQIQCLDTAGNSDVVSGKIVWLSIGMSNCTQETQQFMPQALAFTGINPKLKLVDGAKGGQVAKIISSPWDSGYQAYWDTVASRLSNAGVSSKQVQVVWFKDADIAGAIPIQTYHDSLVVRFKRIMNEIKTRFPNTKICYMASRISARYASATLNPEPYSYWQGWAVKKVIEAQINGDPKLVYSGSGAKAPWISWGIYMWSDGSIPQVTNPNVFFTCPTDFSGDGTHPSFAGAQKVGSLLLNFFNTDSTATPWFLGNGCSLTQISNLSQDKIPYLNMSPNPASGSFTIRSLGSEIRSIEISNLSGEIVHSAHDVDSISKSINFHALSNGIYIVKIKLSDDSEYREKLILTH